VAQKNATPTKEQGKVLKQHGLNPLTWVVIQEFTGSIIVKDRFTGEIKHIRKDQ
jgi:hypothetical protein